MALTPIDTAHALQIQAGTIGRNAGHDFEAAIAQEINDNTYPFSVAPIGKSHVFIGFPAISLLHYIGNHLGIKCIQKATAISTGALATSEAGKQWLNINGSSVSRCKSDLVITIKGIGIPDLTFGVSAKQCNNPKPTNAQLYFTTARGFVNLLITNGIPVSDECIKGMRRFCGDAGFRPSDDPALLAGRKTDPRRFFWEEIGDQSRAEWEAILGTHQDKITTLLLQKAYLDDPFVPEYLLHKTKRATSLQSTEVAIYSIAELVALSRAYQGYTTRAYSVRKGSHKDPPGVSHLAPRFGVVQMQRGGQKQHPEQLQFNLETGYFYNLSSE
jgi:hypothetical protein